MGWLIGIAVAAFLIAMAKKKFPLATQVAWGLLCIIVLVSVSYLAWSVLGGRVESTEFDQAGCAFFVACILLTLFLSIFSK